MAQTRDKALCEWRLCEEMQSKVTMRLEAGSRTKSASGSGQGCAKGVATGLWAGRQALMR